MNGIPTEQAGQPQVSVSPPANGFSTFMIDYPDTGKHFASTSFKVRDQKSVLPTVRKFAALWGVQEAVLHDALRAALELTAQARNGAAVPPPIAEAPALEPGPARSSPRTPPTASTARPRVRLLRRHELAEIPQPSWLVKDVLPSNALALLYGERSSYKSFLALDLACSLVTGTPWQGRTVQKGCVLLIAAEGGSGLHDRLAAWEQAHQRRADRLLVLPEPISLLEAGNGDALVDAIREALTPGERLALVIVDTLHLCTPDGDENSAGTAAQALGTLGILRRAFGCTCLLLHHPTKSNAQQHRGTGAYADDVDVVIRAARDGNTVTLHCEKQRDAEAFQSIALALESQADSLVVRLADERGDAPLTPEGLTPADRKVLAALYNFREEAVSWTRLSEVSDTPKATLSRSRRALLDLGFVEMVRVGPSRLACRITNSGIEEHLRFQGSNGTSREFHGTSGEQPPAGPVREGSNVPSEVPTMFHGTSHSTQVPMFHRFHPPLGGNPMMEPESGTSVPPTTDQQVPRPGEPQ